MEMIGEVISFLIGAITGSLVTLSVTRNRAGRNGTASSQSGKGTQQTGNSVGGDMAGRDVNKR